MAEAQMLDRALRLATTIRTGPPVRYIEYRDFLFVTTTWGLTGWRDHAAPDAIREMLDRTSRFMRHHGEPRVWVYNQESGADKGVHWHWVVYVPPHLNDRFERLFIKWLKLPPKRPRARAKAGHPVKFKRVFRMEGLIQYLLKDGDDDVRRLFKIPDSMARSRGDRITKGVRVSISDRLREAIADAAAAAESDLSKLDIAKAA